MKIRKGDVIHTRLGNSYEVLATRKNKYCNRQDLLLKDKKTKAIVIVNKWHSESVSNPKYGSWSNGSYYGQCNLYQTNSIKNDFKKGR